MEPDRLTGADRRRAEDETRARRRKQSVRIGAAGIVVLFAAAIGVVLSPGNALWLLALMGASIVLLGIAFFLIRTPMTDLLRMPPAK